MNGDAHRGVLGAAILLALASGLTTAVVVIHPSVPSDAARLFELIRAQHARWNIVHDFVLLTALSWLITGLFLAARLYPTRPRAAVAGGMMTTVGSVALAGIGASEIVLAKVAVGIGGAPGSGLSAQLDGNGAVVYLVPFVISLTVGLAVLAAALWSARLISGWAAIAFVVGTVLSNPPIPHAVNIVGQAVQLIAALTIAGALIRGNPQEGHSLPTPSGRAETEVAPGPDGDLEHVALGLGAHSLAARHGTAPSPRGRSCCRSAGAIRS